MAARVGSVSAWWFNSLLLTAFVLGHAGGLRAPRRGEGESSSAAADSTDAPGANDDVHPVAWLSAVASDGLHYYKQSCSWLLSPVTHLHQGVDWLQRQLSVTFASPLGATSSPGTLGSVNNRHLNMMIIGVCIGFLGMLLALVFAFTTSTSRLQPETETEAVAPQPSRTWRPSRTMLSVPPPRSRAKNVAKEDWCSPYESSTDTAGASSSSVGAAVCAEASAESAIGPLPDFTLPNMDMAWSSRFQEIVTMRGSMRNHDSVFKGATKELREALKRSHMADRRTV